MAPFVMFLPYRPSGRQPDLLFIRAEHLDRLKPTHLDGPADLVIEIRSPDSETRDRCEKYQEYEAAGIPEYWILDPLRCDAFLFLLGEDGRYRQAFADAAGIYHSPTLAGIQLKVEGLWPEPLHSPEKTLRELSA
jgi:Uma2 family endonuclease